MARGRKKGIRISNGALNKARKKIKETPKRGRWPKFENINPQDLDHYIELYKFPSKAFKHPRHGNLCFGKTLHRGENQVKDPNFDVILPDEYKIIGSISFWCTSYNREEGWLIDTCCRNTGIYSHPKIGCQRISCPYHKKGFIEETLKNKTFAEDVENIMNKRHNVKVDDKNE